MSGDRPAATASGSASAFIPRPAPVGVALPDLAAGHRRDGIGQAGDRGPMASQGLPALLAVAITPSGATQDRHRNPLFDPPHGPSQPAVGGAPPSPGTAQAR